jgi:hypothetical protein
LAAAIISAALAVGAGDLERRVVLERERDDLVKLGGMQGGPPIGPRPVAERQALLWVEGPCGSQCLDGRRGVALLGRRLRGDEIRARCTSQQGGVRQNQGRQVS